MATPKRVVAPKPRQPVPACPEDPDLLHPRIGFDETITKTTAQLRAPVPALSRTLRKLDACDESIRWAESRQGERSYRLAWEQCQRGDWMLWIAGRLGIDRRLLVLAACACAELALRFVPAGEQRPGLAIETMRRWARGEATIEEVRAARAGAWRARADAADYAAADAADAASAVDYAAADYAAYAAADAAVDADADAAAARAAMRARCADAIRAVVPWPVVRDALRAWRGA